MDNKQQKNKQIKLDEYESSISLWQLLPCGNGQALKKLKDIVNSILHGQAHRETPKPLSLLIVGQVGKKCHAFSFLRALAAEFIFHSSASMLSIPIDFTDFFYGATVDNGYIISDLNLLPSINMKKLYQILNSGYYSYMDVGSGLKKSSSPVMSPIVCTVNTLNLLPDTIINSFEFVVQLGEYTPAQKELILYQRLKYAGIEILDENVLKTIMQNSPSDLKDLLKLLSLSIVKMLAAGRDVLTSEDVRKGKELW